MHTQIGHYQIVSELGRGGMGVVYKGYEPALSRHVAIKLMSEALAHQPEVVERFLREARSMGQLSDPHIVQVYFIGEHAGQPFFAMEFVEGETVGEYLRREGRIEPALAAGLLLQAAQGLAVAHERGVIHRDIKPANLMLTPRGLLKVTDFGIALAQRDAAAKLTGTGQFVGTPGYLSPEVCLGHPIDARADIFSLGIVFFEMLAGRMPFTDASPLGMMLEVVQSGIPDIRSINAEVPVELVAILQRMLEKDPARRYPDCEALIADLQAVGVVVRRQVSAPALGSPSSPGRITSGAAATLRAPTPGFAATRPVTGPTSVGPPTLGPPTLPARTPVVAAAPPLAGSPARAPARSTHAGLGIAVVAVLVLVSVGAVAGLYRHQISQWFQRQPVPVATIPSEMKSAASANRPPDPASPSTLAGAGETGDVAVDAAAGSAVASAGEAAAATPSATPSATAAATLTAPPAEAPAGAPAATVEALPDSTAAQLAEMRRLAAELDEKTRAAQQAQAEIEAAQSAPAAAPAVAFQPRRAARETEAPAPATLPAMPAQPRIAVIAFGDPAIAAAAELAVENALRADGYLLADEEQLPGIRRLRAARTPPVAELTQMARRGGVAGLVLIRVNDLGRQTLNFYGQSAEVTSATVELAVHDVVNRDNRSRSVSDTINYTPLNAAERAREAVGPQLDGVLLALGPFRSGG